ncbi:MAG: hypothetical protein FWE54_01680 [Methanimicrococcus sp.]|nr:hypothetical protein [Methanimicrococcus sp.]
MVDEYDPFDDAIDIVGFSQKSEYAYMFTNYTNRTFHLLSHGKVDEAMCFFYNVLGDFAVIFDKTFLKNCINIRNRIVVGDLSKSDYINVYHLQKAQFSRLMIRAHVCLQPDVHDNRFPSYDPAQKPGGI